MDTHRDPSIRLRGINYMDLVLPYLAETPYYSDIYTTFLMINTFPDSGTLRTQQVPISACITLLLPKGHTETNALYTR